MPVPLDGARAARKDVAQQGGRRFGLVAIRRQPIASTKEHIAHWASPLKLLSAHAWRRGSLAAVAILRDAASSGLGQHPVGLIQLVEHIAHAREGTDLAGIVLDR